MSLPAKPPFVLLDDNLGSGRRGSDKRALLFANPSDVVIARDGADVPAALEKLDAARAGGFHVAGFMAYEAGYALEPRLRPLAPRPGALPLLWFGVFDAPRVISGNVTAELDPVRYPAEALATLADLRFDVTAETYAAAIARIQDYLHAGDCYQINYTFPVRFEWRGRPLDLFRRLRRAQPVSFGAWLSGGDWQVLSFSPELFFEKRGSHLVARPMKGTARRGASVAEDQARAAALRDNPKDRAENLMIVDLLRNDLSRVALPGSVAVPRLYEVETYRTLLQMTSTVTAQVDTDIGLAALMRTLFPCGSVTGAPKIRAMEIIRDLEQAPRGVYTGAIGYATPDGDMTFSVPIRTLTLLPLEMSSRRWSGVLGIGSGIVVDSDASAEYQECLLKARFLTAPMADFDLLETLRWQPDSGYARLDLHLARLRQSAAYFDFSYDDAAVRDQLAAHAAHLPPAPHRVRLLLSQSGALALCAEPLHDMATPVKLYPSSRRLDADDIMLRHKTTARNVYAAALGEAHAHGGDEAILQNQHGRVTEGSFTSLFVRRRGMLLTPPLSDGALPGVLRAELLASGAAREAPLTLHDLRTAEALYVGNSLRGLMPATLLNAT